MNSLKRTFFLPFLLLVVSFSHLLATHEGSPPQWEWRNPLPQGNPLYGIAVGSVTVEDEDESTTTKPIYVAVGEAGTSISSHDRVEWEVGYLGNNSWYTDIVYASGMFVAVGSEGSIATSKNGTEWTQQDSGTFQWLWSITWDGIRFVAVGSAGTIATSADGEEWEVWDMGEEEFENVWLQGIAHNGSTGSSTYVAVSDEGKIFHSSDLEEWVENEDVDPGVPFEDVTFTHRGFIVVGAAGYVFESADGTGGWDELFLPSFQYFWNVTEHDDIIRIIGRNGTIIKSTGDDGWELEHSGTLHFLRASAAGSGGWAAVGNAGVVIARVLPEDENGETGTEEVWQDQSSGSRNWLFDILHTGETWIAVGDAGRILKYVVPEIPDGEEPPDEEEEPSWESLPSNTTNWLRAIVQNDDGTRLVVVGHSGTIRFSDDSGEEWEEAESGTTRALEAIAYGGPGDAKWYVAVGADGTILQSADGEEWELIEVFEFVEGEPEPVRVRDDLHTVMFAEGYFWAAGRRGRLMRSTNGSVWETIETPTNLAIHSLAFGVQEADEDDEEAEDEDIFVAVGRNGLVLSSPDGEEWSVNTFSPIFDFNSVRFAEGRFIVVGNFGRAYTSLDGVHWTFRRSGTHRNLWGSGDTEDEFLIVGEGGTILESLVPSVDALVSYWVWLDHFELFEPEERAVDANPGGDLVPNLLKFITEQNPLANTREELPAVEIYRQGGQQYISLVFVEATNRAGVNVTLQRSTDLLNWAAIEPIEEILEFIDETTWRVRWTDPDPLGAAPDRRFLRLYIELTEPEPE